MFEMVTGVPSPLLSPDSSFLFSFEGSCTFKTKYRFRASASLWSSVRPISTSQLHPLLNFHLRPINVVVSHGSYLKRRKSFLVGGFALRCFQRLSRP